jgi:hypothetical protein
MRHTLAFTLALGTVLLLGSTAAFADTYMKQIRRTEPYIIMNQSQPATSETVETWIGDKAIRINNPDGTSTIIVHADQKAYILKHSDRAYAEMPLDMGQVMDEMAAAAGEDEEDKTAAAAMRDMMGAMVQFKISVTETGEEKKIGSWHARKYIMTNTMPMGTSTSEVWATEDIEADMSGYWKAVNITMAGQEGFEEMMAETEKIRGVTVMSVNRAQVMGVEVKSTEELVEFATKSAPSGTFEVPAGYRKASMFGE